MDQNLLNVDEGCNGALVQADVVALSAVLRSIRGGARVPKMRREVCPRAVRNHERWVQGASCGISCRIVNIILGVAGILTLRARTEAPRTSGSISATKWSNRGSVFGSDSSCAATA